MTGETALPMVASDEKEAAMSATKPDINYRVEQKTDASPAAIYAVLADPNRSLEWSGKEAPVIFRLRDLHAPDGPLTEGQTWTSNGVVGYFKFQDRSTVVITEPGRAFGFDTESTVERRVRPTWYGRFESRYTIRPDGSGSIIEYTCDGYATKYRAYMWWPGFKVMTKMMFTMLIKKTMKKLARQAAAKEAALA
jgi:hypothetical protein